MTGRFVAAKFEPDTARSVDGYVAAQPHTHAVVFNITERDGGGPVPCRPRVGSTTAVHYGCLQSELIFRLRNLGYELETGPSGAMSSSGSRLPPRSADTPRS